MLAKGVEQIHVAEVISAVDESVDTTRCGGGHNCQGNERCLTHDLWHDLRTGYMNTLTRSVCTI